LLAKTQPVHFRNWQPALGFLVFACSATPDTVNLEPTPNLTEVSSPFGFSGSLASTAPADNQLTESRAKLGRRLFFETALSRTREVSCSSCHEQSHAFADPRTVSVGVEGKMGLRNAPGLANLAWVRTGLFWDGRVASLEEQTGKPIEDANEMDLPLSEAVARLNSDASYVAEFQAAYAEPPSELSLRQALASFVRTLVSSNSRYDAFLTGDSFALSDSEQRGSDLFFSSRTGCFHCHTERTLTNDGFFNNGSYEPGGDIGRKGVTGRTGDLGKFRVPGLRNIALTAPYLHDGSLPTLSDVIDHYAKGGRGDPSTDVQIEPFELNAAEKADLLAFLGALTDQKFLTDPKYIER